VSQLPWQICGDNSNGKQTIYVAADAATALFATNRTSLRTRSEWKTSRLLVLLLLMMMMSQTPLVAIVDNTEELTKTE